MLVRTRFAPSPTGHLHIGGLRSALFSYLWAKKNNGKFFLRIEDTDRSRYVEGAVDSIKKALLWAGLKWDDEPIFQSDRLDLYSKAAEKLLNEGKAYRCFCSEARLDRVRKLREQNKLPSGYDRKCRNLTQEEIDEHLAHGDPYVIRLKVPLEGETICHDLIRGEIRFDNNTLEDIVLIKSDSFPTYHMAHVVDDHDMQITHVTRGEEWISSMPVHILLFQALGYEIPAFVHFPVVLGKDGKKLSKRDGAASIIDFIEMGYLPEAVVNYLALLGWSYDDQKQIFSMDELIQFFDISKISKASAVFSYEKLDWYNGYYLRQLPLDDLYQKALPYFIKAGYVSNPPSTLEKEYILKILPEIRERIFRLKDIESYCKFFFHQPEIYNPDDFTDKGRDLNRAIEILKSILPILKETDFNIQSLEDSLKIYIDKTGIKVKDCFMPIRVAVCGSKYSPGLFETLSILGKEESLKRIENAIKYLGSSQLNTGTTV
ncbi:MAG: glutamate--tRNA ligase [Spirochaetes bacterium]|nr:glutamate--tRNA ligase [Spirochaetota bacterium]